jgi:hypothetical protein
MRCKPGDLAIVIRSSFGNEGREVTVVRWVMAHEQVAPRWECVDFDGWAVQSDSPLRGRNGFADMEGPYYGVFHDNWLMPIRPEREPESVTTEDTASA